MDSLREDPILRFTARMALETGKEELGRSLVMDLSVGSGSCSVSPLTTLFRKLGAISGRRISRRGPRCNGDPGLRYFAKLNSSSRHNGFVRIPPDFGSMH
jgi:hypothetical protein